MKKTLLLNILPLFFCLFLLTGCGKIKIDWVDDNKNSGDYVDRIATTLNDRSAEDCEYLYKVYSGGALYLEKKSDQIGGTMEWEQLLQKVHKDFGWLDSDLKSKDADFSDTFKAELEKRGLGDPKSLSDIDIKNKVVKILNETAEGALKAKNSK